MSLVEKLRSRHPKLWRARASTQSLSTMQYGGHNEDNMLGSLTLVLS